MKNGHFSQHCKLRIQINLTLKLKKNTYGINWGKIKAKVESKYLFLDVKLNGILELYVIQTPS